ncbi:O-antigen ligase family protein [Vibrio viridaestus]|uniref:O-antigen ligase family protein n=1 Tax=Vibrio viridaestus TaxID=2487322 RepID=A0A3N9THW5_9VIBR|nr:O-antigen ligase family protein [Vibrio viridaestus]RQW63888.1 O-antigen ligase family protein [Vibrio viridaestus]
MVVFSLERFCFLITVVLLFWLPLPLGSLRAWAWSLAEFAIAIQTILVLISFRNCVPFERLKAGMWLLAPLALFQVWVLIQIIPIPGSLLSLVSPNAYDVYANMLGEHSYFISLDPYSTFMDFLKGLAYSLFVFNNLILISTPKRIRIVLYILVFSGFYQAVYATLEVLLHVKHTWILGLNQGEKANGTFVYHNHLANYLLMTLCMGFGLIVTQLYQTPSGSWFVRIRRWTESALSRKMFIRLCLVVMVIALVLTRSRMGNTAFFLSSILTGITALIFYKRIPRSLIILIVSILAIDTFIIGSTFGIDKVAQRIEASSAQTETRDEVVKWGLTIVKDFPLTGTGLGSFYSIFPKYTKYNIGYYDYAHNEYLQFAIECGLPALLLLAFIVLMSLFKNVQTISKRNSKTMKGTALGCFMAIVGMMIHISVDFNLRPPANVITFLIILTLSAVCAHIPATRNEK